jgi:hypothetical protein
MRNPVKGRLGIASGYSPRAEGRHPQAVELLGEISECHGTEHLAGQQRVRQIICAMGSDVLQ